MDRSPLWLDVFGCFILFRAIENDMVILTAEEQMHKRTKFTFWGVRGSTPALQINVGKYGGHTSCSSILSSKGDVIIIDTGTGAAKLGQNLMRKKKGRRLNLSIIYTHFHLDHIQGLPFFSPLYSSLCCITFYSFLSPGNTEACLRRLMGGRMFPVGFRETPSRKVFKKIPSGPFKIGNVGITSCPLIHPQGSRAYRFHTADRSIVLATDTEHPENGVHEELVSLSSGADFLVYDAMFTPAEYRAGKKNWGHSTWIEGTKVAKKAGIKNLYLSHFNPWHADEKIEQLLLKARRIFPETFTAEEGTTIDL